MQEACVRCSRALLRRRGEEEEEEEEESGGGGGAGLGGEEDWAHASQVFLADESFVVLPQHYSTSAGGAAKRRMRGGWWGSDRRSRSGSRGRAEVKGTAGQRHQLRQQREQQQKRERGARLRQDQSGGLVLTMTEEEDDDDNDAGGNHSNNNGGLGGVGGVEDDEDDLLFLEFTEPGPGTELEDETMGLSENFNRLKRVAALAKDGLHEGEAVCQDCQEHALEALAQQKDLAVKEKQQLHNATVDLKRRIQGMYGEATLNMLEQERGVLQSQLERIRKETEEVRNAREAAQRRVIQRTEKLRGTLNELSTTVLERQTRVEELERHLALCDSTSLEVQKMAEANPVHDLISFATPKLAELLAVSPLPSPPQSRGVSPSPPQSPMPSVMSTFMSSSFMSSLLPMASASASAVAAAATSSLSMASSASSPSAASSSFPGSSETVHGSGFPGSQQLQHHQSRLHHQSLMTEEDARHLQPHDQPERRRKGKDKQHQQQQQQQKRTTAAEEAMRAALAEEMQGLLCRVNGVRLAHRPLPDINLGWAELNAAWSQVLLAVLGILHRLRLNPTTCAPVVRGSQNAYVVLREPRMTYETGAQPVRRQQQQDTQKGGVFQRPSQPLQQPLQQPQQQGRRRRTAVGERGGSGGGGTTSPRNSFGQGSQASSWSTHDSFDSVGMDAVLVDSFGECLEPAEAAVEGSKCYLTGSASRKPAHLCRGIFAVADLLAEMSAAAVATLDAVDDDLGGSMDSSPLHGAPRAGGAGSADLFSPRRPAGAVGGEAATPPRSPRSPAVRSMVQCPAAQALAQFMEAGMVMRSWQDDLSWLRMVALVVSTVSELCDLLFLPSTSSAYRTLHAREAASSPSARISDVASRGVGTGTHANGTVASGFLFASPGVNTRV